MNVGIKCLQEGCKQAKNPFIPKISLPLPLKEILNNYDFNQIKAYFGAVNGDNSIITSKSGFSGWFIGPEGGFTENEENLLIDNNINGIKSAVIFYESKRRQ